MAFPPLSNYKAVFAAGVILVSTLSGESIFAQERSQCFMVGTNGELLDLTSVCSPLPRVSSQKKTEPSPEPTPTSNTTEEAPTKETSTDAQGEKPPNSYIRYGSGSSGVTQADDTETTGRLRKHERGDLRRESARESAPQSQ